MLAAGARRDFEDDRPVGQGGLTREKHQAQSAAPQFGEQAKGAQGVADRERRGGGLRSRRFKQVVAAEQDLDFFAILRESLCVMAGGDFSVRRSQAMLFVD